MSRGYAGATVAHARAERHENTAQSRRYHRGVAASERRRRGPMSAAELMEELANDADYQARRSAVDAEQATRTQALRLAERPIVADLNKAGIAVGSVWDLVNTSDPYPDALPVLLDHLEHGGYPDRVMESLGRALAVRPSVMWWDRLRALYADPRSDGEEDGVAIALAACATKDQLNDLLTFLAWTERGQSRIYFLRPIKRLGGDNGRAVLERLKDDEVFGGEASALLRRSRKRG